MSSVLEAFISADDALLESCLKSGSDPNVRDPEGSSALIYAVNHNRDHAVRLLLSHGANPNLANRLG